MWYDIAKVYRQHLSIKCEVSGSAWDVLLEDYCKFCARECSYMICSNYYKYNYLRADGGQGIMQMLVIVMKSH